MAVGLRCVYLGLALMHVPWIEGGPNATGRRVTQHLGVA